MYDKCHTCDINYAKYKNIIFIVNTIYIIVFAISTITDAYNIIKWNKYKKCFMQ